MDDLRESGRIQNGRILTRWRGPLVYFQVFGVCAVQLFLSSSCDVFQERSSLKALNDHFTWNATRWPIRFYVRGGQCFKASWLISQAHACCCSLKVSWVILSAMPWQMSELSLVFNRINSAEHSDFCSSACNLTTATA